jgi:hypothetical protein
MFLLYYRKRMPGRILRNPYPRETGATSVRVEEGAEHHQPAAEFCIRSRGAAVVIGGADQRLIRSEIMVVYWQASH